MARQLLIVLSTLLMLGSAAVAATGAAGDKPAQESTLDLSPYIGKVVYVDFWASWCGPCKKSFPWMIALDESLSNDGLVMITINVDHERKAADAFLERVGSKLPVIYDPQGQIAAAYKLEVMPSSFVYGRKGSLRAVHVGFHPDQTEAIEKELRELLAEEGNHETEK